MLKSYSVTREPDEQQGKHIVHTGSCLAGENPDEYHDLGPQPDCDDAIRDAKEICKTDDVNGCEECCPKCFTPPSELEEESAERKKGINVELWRRKEKAQGVEENSQAIIAAQPGTYAVVSQPSDSEKKIYVPVIAWKIMDSGRSIPIFPHGWILGEKWKISIEGEPDYYDYQKFAVESIKFNSTIEEECELENSY